MLFCVVGLVGCKAKYNYYLLQNTDFWGAKGCSIVAMLDSNEFDINRVTFNIGIGLHKLNVWGVSDKNPIEQYPIYTDDAKICFGLYLCKQEGMDLFKENYCFTDISCIDNHIFLNEISQNDAFEKEYGYRGYNMNHVESFVMPKELFAEQEGIFLIRMVLFLYNFDTNSWISLPYCVYDIPVIYEKADDRTIVIMNCINGRGR